MCQIISDTSCIRRAVSAALSMSSVSAVSDPPSPRVAGAFASWSAY